MTAGADLRTALRVDPSTGAQPPKAAAESLRNA